MTCAELPGSSLPGPGPTPSPEAGALAGPEAPEPPGSPDPSAGRGRRLSQVLTAVVLVAMVLAAFRMRGTLGDAVSGLASLPAWAMLAVGGVYGLVVLARASLQRWSLPRATLGEGVVLDQVNLAVTNAVPGGVVLGGALRYRIGRSRGQAPEAMALSLLTVGQAMSATRWALAAVAVAATLAIGAGGAVDVALLASSVVAVLASVGLWFVVTTDSRASRAAIRSGQAAIDRLATRVPRLRDVHLEPFAKGVGARAAELFRARAGRLLACAAAVTLGGATIVAVVVLALDGPGGPGPLDVIRVYLLVRIAAGLSPTPGNVGVVEGALVAGLVAAGADPASAVAGVVVYRGLTYALPIATGSALFLRWRRQERRAALAGTGAEPADLVEVTAPPTPVVPVAPLAPVVPDPRGGPSGPAPALA